MGPQADRFCAFMEEYAGFMGEMAAQEDKKYSALISNDLERMDKAIADQQSMLMRLEKLERRRAEVQKAAGWEGLTFSRILEQMGEGPRRKDLEEIFTRIGRMLEQIRYSNEKSMSFARMNLQISSMLAPEEGQTYDAGREKSQRDEAASGMVFETKV